MATQPVFANLSGTTWTLDVTAAELISDTSIKDFVVLFDSVLQSPALFTKLGATSIQYSGPSMNALVEVRRDTDVAPYQLVAYRSPILSDDYNENLKKISRKLEEIVKFPPGFASVPSISDQPYGPSWSSDTINAPARSSMYAEIESVKTNYAAADSTLLSNINTRAPLDSPALTGSPTAPTPTALDNTTKLATTQFVNTALTPYALRDNPIFTGTPSAPTPAFSSNNNTIPTTAWVVNRRSPVRIINYTFTNGLSMDVPVSGYTYYEFLFQAPTFLGALSPTVENPSYFMRLNGIAFNSSYLGVGQYLDRVTLTSTIFNPNASAPYFGNAVILEADDTGFTCVIKARIVKQSGALWSVHLESQRHVGNVSLNDYVVRTSTVDLSATGNNDVVSIQIGAIVAGVNSNNTPIVPTDTRFQLWGVSY